jgi:hypothetical protein
MGAYGERPAVVSIVAILTFLLGLVGLSLGIIAGVGALLLSVNAPAFYVLVLVFWYVAGPCLILAGYYLWKGKKWAAQLAAAIVLFDLIVGTSRGNISSLVIDMVFLGCIGLAWKHLK